MKFKTTRKEIVNNYSNIRAVGYCDLYYLLSFKNPSAYTCGVYGWNFDVYALDGLTICTGYRNMPGKAAQSIKEYEAKAKKIFNSCKDWKEKEKEINKLLQKFCELNK